MSFYEFIFIKEKKRNKFIVYNVFVILFFKIKKYFMFDFEVFLIFWVDFYLLYCVKKLYEECFDKVW